MRLLSLPDADDHSDALIQRHSIGACGIRAGQSFRRMATPIFIGADNETCRPPTLARLECGTKGRLTDDDIPAVVPLAR